MIIYVKHKINKSTFPMQFSIEISPGNIERTVCIVIIIIIMILRRSIHYIDSTGTIGIQLRQDNKCVLFDIKIRRLPFIIIIKLIFIPTLYEYYYYCYNVVYRHRMNRPEKSYQRSRSMQRTSIETPVKM